MLVSIITPVFNMSNTLQRAHESVLRQAGRWEHIIVDDGSTDATPLVMAELAKDPRVVCAHTANRGAGAAHNTGLDLVTGDFVAFLDADDEYLPNHLSSHLAAMDAYPEVDIFWGISLCDPRNQRQFLLASVRFAALDRLLQLVILPARLHLPRQPNHRHVPASCRARRFSSRALRRFRQPRHIHRSQPLMWTR